MTTSEPRGKEDRDRIRFTLLMWILEAGVLSRTTLRDRLLEEDRARGLPAWGTLTQRQKQAFNNHLSRDLEALRKAGMIQAIRCTPDGPEEHDPDPDDDEEGARTRQRNQIYYRALLERDFVVFSPGGPTLEVDGLAAAEELDRRLEREPPRGPAANARAELAFALADLQAATGPHGVGRQLLDRVQEALTARLGNALPRPPVRYRPLPPSLGERGRARIRPGVWEALGRAFAQGLRIRILPNGQRALKATDPRYSPLRIVWFNGRPRVELYWHHLDTRRFCAIPLHYIQAVTVLEDQPIDPGRGPDAEERAILDTIWGLDLGERPVTALELEDRTRLRDRTDEVELEFRGDAAQAVFNDPGCHAVHPTKEQDAGGLLVRYEVRTIVGRYFKNWLRQWGHEVKVVRPAWLAAEMAQVAKAVYEAHREAGADASS